MAESKSGGDRADLKKDMSDDLVMLDDISEASVTATLESRYVVDNIYTYIGPVVLVVNPYKLCRSPTTGVDIYDESYVRAYQNRQVIEVPPHTFAVGEAAYRAFVSGSGDAQCIIISGESGAGKTEAAKQILRYIALVSSSSVTDSIRAGELSAVTRVMLESNALLEAFGNAQTLRNNNSSRFGKYMALSLDFRGSILGGDIATYLLEKSRVVGHVAGERTFHAFHMLCAGYEALPGEEGGAATRARLGLDGGEAAFAYLNRTATTVPGMDDKEAFAALLSSMDVVGIDAEGQLVVAEVLAAILHLGNITLVEGGGSGDGAGGATVMEVSVLDQAARLLGLGGRSDVLTRALCSRTISVRAGRRQSLSVVPLDVDQATSSRDSLAKALYERLFGWIVGQVNRAIGAGSDGATASQLEERKDGAAGGGGEVGRAQSIGILDIYGFEIFEKNSFEQLCINYVNEKLQQVFIELTLKAEQDEYAAEGIAWTPIDYFNNQVVCDLIEKKNNSIFALMTEQCAIADSTDDRLLSRLQSTFGSHAHFATSKFAGTTFVIKHYAGDVEYDISGMLDKNNDTLFKDLIECMSASSTPLLQAMFVDKRTEDEKKHRPPTAVTQFKGSVNALMRALKASNPHYVRCIKPNADKKCGVFNRDLVAHQVRYLGLVENVRVRRAGFCFRAKFETFVARYKPLSSRTWPNPEGWGPDAGGTPALPAGEASAVVLEDPAALFTRGCGGASAGPLRRGEAFQLGKSKVFIKEPRDVLALEEARERVIPLLVTFIQKMVRRVQTRRWYLRTHANICRLQASYKSRLAVHRLKQQRQAGTVLQAAWRGLQTRRGMSAADWKSCHLAALTLRAQLHRYMGRKERRRLSLDRTELPQGDYLNLASNPAVLKMLVNQGQQSVLFADNMDKINNKNKTQGRTLLVSDDYIYNLTQGGKPKEQRRIAIASLGAVAMSTLPDNYVVLKIPDEYDYLLVLDRKIEMVNVLRERYRYLRRAALPVEFNDEIAYAIKGGKAGRVIFQRQPADFFSDRKRPCTTFHEAIKATTYVHIAREQYDVPWEGEGESKRAY